MQSAREGPKPDGVVMSAEVIDLKDRRLATGSPKTGPRLSFRDGDYICSQCQGDKFSLWVGGRIVCAKCGAFMNNLRVIANNLSDPK